MIASKKLATADDELIVFHVQDPVSPQIRNKLGSAEVEAYQLGQAEKVLKPIKQFLEKQAVSYRCVWVMGAAASEIIRAHGHGMLVRALMGSVARRVMADCDIPVLMVK